MYESIQKLSHLLGASPGLVWSLEGTGEEGSEQLLKENAVEMNKKLAKAN